MIIKLHIDVKDTLPKETIHLIFKILRPIPFQKYRFCKKCNF